MSPASATMHPGDTLRLKVTGSVDCSSSITSWRWRSSDTTVASIDSLSGLVHATRPGTATAIAAAVQIPSVMGASAINVNP
ncbi:MAG: Ig-like domain-containing protein [Gemmatimonadaceae bacterium]